MDFFFKLTSNSGMLHIYNGNLSRIDGCLYHCFCVILIYCIGFLMRLPTFG